MSVVERTLSYMLRNSGDVLDEVEHRDVVLQRRDGEDLHLALRSRERGIRESLEVFVRLVRAALREPSTRPVFARWLSAELPWTTFLPPDDRESFLDDFVQTAAACVDVDQFEPLVRSLDGWKATAEAYATPGLAERMTQGHRGPSVALRRPTPKRARAR